MLGKFRHRLPGRGPGQGFGNSLFVGRRRFGPLVLLLVVGFVVRALDPAHDTARIHSLVGQQPSSPAITLVDAHEGSTEIRQAAR